MEETTWNKLQFQSPENVSPLAGVGAHCGGPLQGAQLVMN